MDTRCVHETILLLSWQCSLNDDDDDNDNEMRLLLLMQIGRILCWMLLPVGAARPKRGDMLMRRLYKRCSQSPAEFV